MALPYDIVGHIIDILAAEVGLTSVKNASLASSSVLHLCRKYIFRTISIYTLPCQISFISLLVNNPAIVQYIRELDYGVHQDHAQLLPLLPNLLKTISHLERLRITSALDNPAIRFDWIQMDPLLRSALLHLMYLPTLARFDITWVLNLPISALVPCINLKHLHISCHSTVTPFEDLGLNPTPLPTPRILHFKTDSESQTVVGSLVRVRWKDGRPVFDFAHLKTLDLDFENVQMTRELFENASHLEELYIRAPVRTQNLAGLSEIISSNARNLRTLEVRSLFKGSNPPVILIIRLCEELEALAGNTVLQVLKFTFFFNGSELMTEVEAGFGRLEEVLMNPGWSTLKCVSIGIDCSNNDAMRLELKSVPEMYLGRLSSRGILDYSFLGYIDP